MIPRFAMVALMTLGAGCTSSDGPSSDGLQIESCHGQSSDPFSLVGIAQQHGLLVAAVQTASNSAHPSFAACWNGGLYDTEPGTADIRLFYDARGDAGEALQTQDIRIDLTPVAEKFTLPIVFKVYVANDNASAKSVTWSH